MIKQKRGVALLFALFVLMALAVLGAVKLGRSVNESSIARRQVSSTHAFWLAEGGLQRGMKAVNEDDWSDWTQEGANTRVFQEDMGGGSYEVTVDGVDTNDIVISSVGTVSGVQRSAQITMQRLSYPRFGYAAFGVDGVTMSGNGYTNSYNSTIGAYGGSNIGSNGDVATLAETSGAVSLSGNAQVRGDAWTGEGGSVSTSGNATITGSTTGTLDAAMEMPSTEIPSDLSALSSSGSISLSGNGTRTISSGSYKYSSIGASGNSTIYINGTVRLYLTSSSTGLSTSGNAKVVVNNGAQLLVYIDGQCDITGNGMVNNTANNKPENLRVYSRYTGSSEGVKIAGNGNLQAAIYAPDTEVKFSGNADVYGSVVGKTVTVTGNGNIHYDEALGSLDTITGGYEFVNWYELSNPYSLE